MEYALAWSLFVAFASWWAIAGLGALGLLINIFCARRKAAKEIKFLQRMYNLSPDE